MNFFGLNRYYKICLDGQQRLNYDTIITVGEKVGKRGKI